MRPNAGVRALTLWLLFQQMDMFRSWDFASLPLFRMRDIMKSTIQNTALQMRYRSITTAKHRALIVSSSNWAAWRQRGWVQGPIGTRGASPAITTSIRSSGHDYSTHQQEKLHKIDLIEFEYNSSESIGHVHQPDMLQWMGWSYPWMRPYQEPKAKSRDDLRVSPVTTTFLPIECNAHTWIAFYGQLYLWIHYSSEACLRR